MSGPAPDDLSAYAPRQHPGAARLEGRLVRLERVVPAHLPALYAAFSAPGAEGNWTYLPYGPFADAAAFEAFAERTYFGDDPCFFTVLSRETGAPLGVLSLMRIDTANGVIEVGHICFSPALQRRPEATEAQYLLMKHVFDTLGYRRYEWKCHNDNAPSHAAALRLGFSFEGLFRQHMIVRGRNRDTAWYAILDHEWPALRSAFETWLSADNFDAEGRQRRRLQDCRPAMATH